jgi:ABC-type nickel/cobalt efflux system permease component RcnA
MRSCSIVGFVAAFLLAWTGDISAHPLGNFSINQYSAVRIGKNEIAIRYVVDMAEIPTFQEIQESALTPLAGASSAYLRRKAESLRESLSLEVDGKKVALRTASREILFPEGAGGLPTMRIAALFKGKFDDSAAGRYELFYRDENFPGRAGWKEIIAGAENETAVIESSVPAKDRSSQLSDYPADLLNAPPQVLEARLTFVASSALATGRSELPAIPPSPRSITSVTTDIANGAAPAGPLAALTSPQASKTAKSSIEESPPVLRPNRQSTPKDSFTELIAAKQLNWSMILFALLIAAALGAFHALEPGHGKTLVAAYLIGSRGTAKHALLLGLIVTASHTAAVYLLGGMVLYASAHVVPEKLYPWLALAAGVMIIALGIVLCVRRLGVTESGHHHAHHDHHHPDHDDHDQAHDLRHSHGRAHHHRHAVSLRELLTLGISGGIVPCPAALVVLLSAVSLQRIGFGLLLIVAFSIGLAVVLIAVGLLMVYARRFMARFQSEGQMLTYWLPLTSSLFIVFFGVGLTGQALFGLGLVPLWVSQ